MNDYLNHTFGGNTVKDYVITLAIVIIGFLCIRILKSIVLTRLKKIAERTAVTIDDFIVKALEKTAVPALYIFVVYMALNYLNFPAKAETAIHNIMIVVITFYLLRLVTMLIEYGLHFYLQHNNYEESRSKEIRGMLIIINIVLWSIAAIFLLDNFGYNVTTVITGLGIGGVAIALASQNILSDLFCYFVIFFDRPFEIGDFIIVDDKMGTVNHIGIKTTRLQSLSGEEVVFSNKDLTDSRVHNYKKMQQRRVLFQIDVVYETPPDVVEEIPSLLKSIVGTQENVTFDRAHFASYGAYSLKYEVVFYVLTGDYNQYMDILQKINFAIFREFSERNIGFAYPTQTLFIPKENQS
ncbi:mechanosensitive ion channel protein MscS [Arachidicoccus ginsenosidimutans]|uniref:mechanosensitive ion channel family protein n=1 Tax=Arachidicoccus sp. BS20 TaxID=1850526 RepID=UPI0007F0CACB|nr:mechanosensitive ion channel family protein [Arachidicoccus sp. BS20]ANI88094.1 mechanosensitive ion channel protein MscS [Arachidicoccus sp. BS20]